MSGAAADGPSVTCGRCGAVAEAPPLTWSYEAGGEGPRYLCERCTREHVRAVEAKLDPAWW